MSNNVNDDPKLSTAIKAQISTLLKDPKLKAIFDYEENAPIVERDLNAITKLVAQNVEQYLKELGFLPAVSLPPRETYNVPKNPLNNPVNREITIDKEMKQGVPGNAQQIGQTFDNSFDVERLAEIKRRIEALEKRRQANGRR